MEASQCDSLSLRNDPMTMVEFCKKRKKEPTKWESDFISLISKRLKNNNLLSDEQIKVLEIVFDSVVTKR